MENIGDDFYKQIKEIAKTIRKKKDSEKGGDNDGSTNIKRKDRK